MQTHAPTGTQKWELLKENVLLQASEGCLLDIGSGEVSANFKCKVGQKVLNNNVPDFREPWRLRLRKINCQIDPRWMTAEELKLIPLKGGVLSSAVARLEYVHPKMRVAGYVFTAELAQDFSWILALAAFSTTHKTPSLLSLWVLSFKAS